MIWKVLQKERKVGEVNFIKNQEQNADNKEPRIGMNVAMSEEMEQRMIMLPTRCTEKVKAACILLPERLLLALKRLFILF